MPPEAAPRASPRPSLPPGAETALAASIGRHFESHVGRRLYIQVDKPLYKPGETIWIKTWALQARNLASRTLAGADGKRAYAQAIPSATRSRCGGPPASGWRARRSRR